MSRHTVFSLEDRHTDWINSVVHLGDSDTLVTASKDRTIRVWSILGERSLRVLPLFQESVNDIAALDGSKVVAVSGRTVYIVSLDSDRILARSAPNSFESTLWSCTALSPTTAIVGDDAGNLYKIKWNNNNVAKIVRRCKKGHEKMISRIFSTNADTFATCSSDKTARLWDSTSLSCKAVFRGNHEALCCVSYDHEILVTGSKDGTVRVFEIGTARLLRSITTHKNWVRCVRIIPHTHMIASSGSDKVIALHSSVTGEWIAEASLGMVVTSISVLKCGKICAVGGRPFSVKVVEIDRLFRKINSKQKASLLEIALLAAVTDPDVLSKEFIVKYINADNVNSAFDLFCGHNIVLLAIRCGVIKAGDVRKFNGDGWFFEENLYFPACKLVQESQAILYPIFRHAQDIGIVRDGHAFRREHDNRVDTNLQLDSIHQLLGALSMRLANTERICGELMDGLERMDKRVDFIADTARQNTQNFKLLFRAIKKKEKYMMYAACVKVMLYLIPLFGKALGEAAYASTGFLLNLTKHDIVKTGADLGTAMTQSVANVDLSNAQVTYCALSENNMLKMDYETKAIIKDAATRSGFKSMESLRSSLRAIIETTALEDKHIAMLDMGSSKWLGEKSFNTTDSVVDSSENREATVRYQFKAIAKGKGTKELKIVDAVEALNAAFKHLGIPKEVAADELERTFVDASEELHVSEDDFYKVFCTISADSKSIDRDRIAHEYAEIFDKNMQGRETAGIEFATRLLRHAVKELLKRGFIGDQSLSNVDITEDKMAEFDTSGYESFNKDEFVEAALSIVHEYHRRSRRRTSDLRRNSAKAGPSKQVRGTFPGRSRQNRE